ncbi:NERD domain-containing protein [Bacillus sp. AK031]
MPKELKILRALRPRMNFNEEEESYYQYKEKGYEGEVTFDKWAEPLKNHIFLNDANFNVNNNNFQVDSLGISSSTLHIFEVKNLEGDYILDEEDKWRSPKGNLVKNPLLQLQKTETLINQLLKNIAWRINVEAHLVFVNPAFHLYDIPSNLPIIYPTQLLRFREKMLQRSSKPTRSEIQLAEKLLSHLIDELPYNSVPNYSYEGLRKGIVCPRCGMFYGSLQKTLYCGKCGGREKCTEAVLRSVRELKLLFPNLKVTSSRVYEWCGVIRDVKTIRRILKDNFKFVGHGKSAHYI